MKKFLSVAWKYAIVIVWFFISIVFFEYFLNLGNTDVTKKMTDASIPVVVMRYENYEYNRMFGYTTEMDYSLIRDGITPLEDGRSVNFRVYKYGLVVDKIEYKLKSLDKTRFIEEGEIRKYTETSDYIDANISLKDLIEKKTDYSLQIIITLKSGEKACYYARIFDDNELDFHDKLAYIYEFSDATFDKDTAELNIGKYLESNKSGDNTNYKHVNINSSLDQVTWGKLGAKRISDPICTVKEIDMKSALMTLEYMIKTEAEEDKTYKVTEEYRFIKGSDRMYLLSFDRYMDTYVFADAGVVYGDKLMLGITDEDFEWMESDDGNTFAFINSDSLFVANSSMNTFGSIYSFYDSKNFDERTVNDDHAIKILNVDESGNVLFYVYGYFNRGDYEGQVGIDVFEYNANLNVVEEKAFLDYSKPYEVLKEDIKRLAYLNAKDEFVVYLDNNIYKINLMESQKLELVTGLETDNLFVSPNQNMIAWSNKRGDSKINFMSLDESKAFTIDADTSQYVVPLGFMGEDLIYGKTYIADVNTDVFGQVTYPMYEINIISQNKKILKTYAQSNAYVTKCKINDNLITLTRVEKNEIGEFESIAPDSIVNTQMEKVYKNSVEVVATENLKKIVQVVLKKEMNNSKTKFLSPQTALYEGRKEINLDPDNIKIENYYVFAGDKCLGIYSEESLAVTLAEENFGCVIDSDGNYIWKKEAYLNTNQIMKIDGRTADDINSSLETCVETVLEYEGFSVDVKDELARGESVTDILEDKMPDAKCIELRNCSYESMKYYLNRDIPMILMAGDNSILVVGYSDNVNVWMNPQSGNIMKVSVDEARKLYEKYGCYFVTYIRPKS